MYRGIVQLDHRSITAWLRFIVIEVRESEGSGIQTVHDGLILMLHRINKTLVLS